MAREPGSAPLLPEGRTVVLPGRGATYVREVEGPPGAPVLVLLHGWTASSALNWFPCFEPLGRHFRVLAPDLRGHGQGIRSRQFRLEDCADDVACLAEQLGIRNVIAVGYSMGGPVAALTWYRHRSLVQGLVLCATAARFLEHRPRHRMASQSLVSLSVAASMSPVAWRRQAMDRLVTNHLVGTRYSTWASEELGRNDPALILRAGASLGRYDARGWIRTVDVPTAVVVTGQDQVVPPSSQLWLAGAIPGAETFGVAGPHAVCVLGAARFVPVLVSACQSVARRAAGRGSPGT
ncbi:MAG: alpha/beta fold hydrolase [Acidimicrobiales bacterium]